MSPVRFDPATPRSRVKHSTIEPGSAPTFLWCVPDVCVTSVSVANTYIVRPFTIQNEPVHEIWVLIQYHGRIQRREKGVAPPPDKSQEYRVS